ncbi:MAG: FimB/Mfa2 family fimbrial subunit [Alistipes sp.]|nr:FimB/Mfa2 family fimbrial subunit [Alistipes sp.]
MNRVHIFRRLALASAMVVAMLATTSCNDGLGTFDGEGDCGVYISFKYDYNIKFANAFVNEVNSVALYVFDEKETLIDQLTTTDKEALSDDEFEMVLQLDPGEYRLLAWGGLMNEESFDLLANAEIGKTKLQELQVRMHRDHNASGDAVVEKDLLPLYHGSMEIVVDDIEGTYKHTMSLMKDTNVVRILLNELSGHEADADDFIFEIEDSNGLYDWDNTLLEDEQITYKAWYKESVSTDTETMSRAQESVGGALAELTIGRIRADRSPILRIRSSETGEDIVRLPLAEYALMVKGQYNLGMSSQEYLDRVDEYNMTLFLNEGEWVSTSILIHSWRVVINNTVLE